MSKKAKNIIFRVDLNGEGIVNYDKNDQKFMFNGSNLHNMKTRYSNTSYAKKKFYGTKEDLRYKISISSDCLRHDIFKGDVKFQSSNIVNDDMLLYSFIASPVSLLRGYVFAEQGETLKRSGPLSITHAEQTCDAISYVEICTKSGTKNSDSEESDTTLFAKETVGKIAYASLGNIDLMQLQFVSCDQIFDRYAFNPDMFNIYIQFLKTKLPNFDSELGYYQIKNSSIEIPEFGVKLTDENIIFLVRELFERILMLDIRRKGSYAKVSKLEYKVVYDVIEDTYESEDNWVSISSKEDLDNISFEINDFYISEDLDKAKTKRADMVADYENRKNGKKEVKAKKTAELKASKLKKTTEEK